MGYRLYKFTVLSALFMQIPPPRPPSGCPPEIEAYWRTAMTAYREAYPR